MFPAAVYFDNGYYDILMQIAYAESAVTVVFVGWVLVSARKLILKAPREVAVGGAFSPASALVLAIVSVPEAVFLASKDLSSVFTVVAATTIVRMKDGLGAGEKATRSLVRLNAAVKFLGSHRRLVALSTEAEDAASAGSIEQTGCLTLDSLACAPNRPYAYRCGGRCCR